MRNESKEGQREGREEGQRNIDKEVEDRQELIEGELRKKVKAA